MAEIIGVIGSSIALVELAGRISVCVLALKRLLIEVRDVSSKLAAMIREVDILESIVEAMGVEFNNNDSGKLGTRSDATNLLVIEYCEKALVDLNIVLQDLAQEIDAPRKLRRCKAAVMVVMKKDVLDSCHTRLQSAVRSLSLTQQWYIMQQQKPPNYTNLWNFGLLGSVAWRYFQGDGRLNPRNFDIIARIQANYWFASRIWDVQASRAPESAPVFCCARNGDIAGLLQLVDLGKASLQDHTPRGQSLMHLAAEYGHLNLVKILVSGGLDLFEFADGFAPDGTLRARLGPRPAELMLISREINATELHQFYLENDNYIVGGLMLHPNESAYLFECISIAHPATISSILPSVLPGFYQRLDLEDRIKYCSFDKPDWNPDVFRLMINPDCGVSREDISNLQKKNVCFLGLMAFRYGPMSMRGSSYHASRWRRLAREVIHLTEDVSFQGAGLDPAFPSREFMNKGLQLNPVLEFLRSIQPLTGLFTALSYFRYEKQEYQTPTCIRDLRKKAQAALTWWLEDLAACKVDLMEYGRRERRIFRHNEKLRQAWYYCDRRIEYEQDSEKYTLDEAARLVDFDYGVNPRDWRLHWNTETERYGGEFWNSIENPLPPC
ncbi:hypothetical protein EKO27_g8047 [Xylaria grammica]|uniref:Uncharacterized protein n=1 Tax=Xylaria grammica TaxID=363999 RepID=A0A439CYG1_9PEZI|nr:hypothetical protein EKO27_g8047 [Xylaria grammica]